jgi:hypothetical protein
MNITVKDEIFIAAPQEEVWTYTQDWRRRKEWDATVVEAEVIEERPPLVRVRAPLGVRYLARYKLYDPPRKTSVALEESTWGVFSGGGGSWDYTPTEGGTIFAQTNTIQIRSRVWSWLLGWAVRLQFRWSTRRGLEKAKRILEAGRGATA